ncbi:MAG: peptidoglycan editing factor PgeF [Peptostreptococcaceae bacterium]|nr:peptidoglycan editing factor PgeF [Peptostreptococcaceae bacterium]
MKIEHRTVCGSMPLFLFDELEKEELQLVMTGSESLCAGISEEERERQLSSVYEYLGISKEQAFAGYQVHGTRIAEVDEKLHAACEDRFFHFEYAETDGLITATEGVCLITKFADCTPIVIFDKRKRILASLHSGWRGTQQKIAEKAIERMKHSYSCDPKDLVVFVGPSIKCKDFEVGKDLVELFEQSHGKIDRYLIPRGEGKFLFDMTSLIVDDLIRNGLEEENIFVSSLSTYEDLRLHSYRRDGASSGRMYLFAMMRGDR